jgi:hypothetical protein
MVAMKAVDEGVVVAQPFGAHVSARDFLPHPAHRGDRHRDREQADEQQEQHRHLVGAKGPERLHRAGRRHLAGDGHDQPKHRQRPATSSAASKRRSRNSSMLSPTSSGTRGASHRRFEVIII